MSRLWVATATFALFAAVASGSIIVLATISEPAELTNHWPEVLMLTLPSAAVVAEAWVARTARRPVQLVTCGAAGLTAVALAYGVVLVLNGRGYVTVARWLQIDVSVWGLMGPSGFVIAVAAVALAYDRITAPISDA